MALFKNLVFRKVDFWSIKIIKNIISKTKQIRKLDSKVWSFKIMFWSIFVRVQDVILTLKISYVFNVFFSTSYNVVFWLFNVVNHNQRIFNVGTTSYACWDGTHFIIWHVNFPKYTKNPYKCIKCSNYLLTQSLFPMINIYFSKSTFLSWKWPVLNKELHVQVFSYDMVKYLPLFLNVIISKTSF